MGDKSAIEWTDATWNPTTGCDRVSPGCANCYALTLAAKMKERGVAAYQRDGDPRTSGPGFGLTVHPDRLVLPLRWAKPRRVFVNSMSDLFHPEVPDHFIDDVFAVMAAAPQHTFQVLTKRPERMREYVLAPFRWRTIAHAGYHLGARVPFGMGKAAGALEGLQDDMPWPIPNVWLGTSVENARWRTRIDQLRATPAAVRFLSCEPLLGSLTDWTKAKVQPSELGRLFFDLTGIDWVIVGGESGPEHRPIDPVWVRQIRDACEAQGAAFFFKQWGGRTPKSGGRLLDGRTHDAMPELAHG